MFAVEKVSAARILKDGELFVTFPEEDALLFVELESLLQGATAGLGAFVHMKRIIPDTAVCKSHYPAQPPCTAGPGC